MSTSITPNSKSLDSTSPVNGYELCTHVLDITGNDVGELIELASGQEADWLELKAACGPPPGNEPRKGLTKGDYRWHVAEAVVSLANTHGGCVLLGVDDDGHPVGLAASDPRDIRLNKGDDAFLQYLDQAVLRPKSGWACGENKGHVTLNFSPPHDLFELKLGKLNDEDVVVILVPPRPPAKICDYCSSREENKCIHCIEEPHGYTREYMPARALGQYGTVRRHYLSQEWQDWEKNRGTVPHHYSELMEQFMGQANNSGTLKGVWHGCYKESQVEYPFKMEIHRERTEGGMRKSFTGTMSEPRRNRRWPGRDVDNLFAEVQGTHDKNTQKIIFKKQYSSPFHHAFNYEGILTDSDSVSGNWSCCTSNGSLYESIRKFCLRKRAGSFYLWRKEHIDILVTSFEPFGSHKENSSMAVADAIKGRQHELSPQKLHVRRLPVEHSSAKAKIEEWLRELKPQMCLCLGMDVSANECRIEEKARRPRGFRREGRKELYGTWPFEQVKEALTSYQVPVKLSSKAGRYVCESTYWSLLNFREQTGYPHYCCFLHVPAEIDSSKADNVACGVISAIRGCLDKT